MFSTDGVDLPIVWFSLTEGNVCGDKREHDVSSGWSYYILLDQSWYSGCNTQIGGVKADPRYEPLGNVNEKQLYDENGVTAAVQGLPAYPFDSMGYEWTLYSNTYFIWFNKCDQIEGQSRDEILQHIKNSMQVAKIQLTCMIICIINTILILLLGCPRLFC